MNSTIPNRGTDACFRYFCSSDFDRRFPILRSVLVSAFLFLCCLSYSQTVAQEADNAAEVALAATQEKLADQLVKLESLLLRSADLESVDNPTRASLLQQAVAVSKQAQLVDSLLNAARNLSASQLSEAIENQKASRDTLKRLLELLQSENREQRVREQRDQVRRWIEETDRLLRMQSSLRGRTEGGQELQQAAEDQKRLGEKAKQISSDLGQLNLKDSNEPASDTEGNEQSTQKPVDRDPSSDNLSTPSGEEQSDKPGSQQEPGDSPEGDGKAQDNEASNDAKQEKPNSDGAADENEASEGKSDQESSRDSSGDQASEKSPSEGDNSGSQSTPIESPSGEPTPSAPSQDQPSQGQPSEGQPSEGQPSQGQPSQGQQSQGQQSQGQPSQGQQSGGKPPASEPQSPTERAQRQIQQAQQNMQQAKQALEEAQRDGAVEKQREAERNLKAAIEQLEQILNQLREEEIQRSLETLETRLRRMLDMQNKVLEETSRLHEIAGEQPDRQVLVRATVLARDQAKVGSEGERALLLLQEEGSSAAFPEAIAQVNRDVTTAANRLEAGDVGAITLVIQSDIVQALEEMVEAVDRVRKDNEQKKQRKESQSPGSQMPPGAQPLIDQLAELRLIRTLQIRVNKRTEVLSKMLTDPDDVVGQASETDLIDQLKELGKRQESIEQVTRTIAQEP